MVRTVFVLAVCFVIPFAAGREFVCNDGRKIPTWDFCDGQEDCDGSDEIIPTGNTNEAKISCSKYQKRMNSTGTFYQERTCLVDVGYICNNTIYCLGIGPCDVGCPNYYKCQSGICQLRSTLCNGDSCDGCKEDDGWKTGIGFQCMRNGEFCRIPQQLLWDQIQDCDQGEDFCYINPNLIISIDEIILSRDIRNLPETTFNRSRCFECLDKSMIIPRHKVCDGVIDCSDLSDECLCEVDEPEVCRAVMQKSAISTSAK